MKTTALVAAIVAGFAVSAAEAHDRSGAGFEMPAFEDIDANGDGGVSLAEVETFMDAQRAARFAAADTNGDGGLSIDEMTAAVSAERAERMAERLTERLEKVDANGDGLLQADEIAAARDDRGRRGPSPERMFERADADADGVLSAAEYSDALERMQERGRRGE